MLFIILLVASTSITKHISLSTAHKSRIVFDSESSLRTLSKLSNENCWYYVYTNQMRKDPKAFFSSFNISFSYHNQISSKIFLIYLNNEQISSLMKTNKDILIKKLNNEDKYLPLENEKSTLDLDGEIENLFVYLEDGHSIPNSTDYTVLRKLSDNLFLIETKKAIRTIESLSSLSHVLFITRKGKYQATNIFASGFIQKNTKSPNKMNDFEYFERYINAKGFSGEDEVVTILDTLIDFNHSMFYDPKSLIVFNKYLPNHRKLVLYMFNGSIQDYVEKLEFSEHGTHVAGTVAGKSLCDSPFYTYMNGVAPEAKIAYFGGFNEPIADDVRKINDLMTLIGSYISTNSWGSKSESQFLNWLYGNVYQAPDKLFIFAAANDRTPTNIYYTVKDPGGNKNILTVGALSPLNDMIEGNFYLYDLDGYVSSVKCKMLYPLGMSINYQIGSYAGIINDDIYPINYEINKNRICEAINNTYISIIFGKENNITDINCSTKNIRNMATLYSSNYELYDSYVQGVEIGILHHQIQALRTVKYESSSYSSVGPGLKGIIKPDVVAPGSEIVSACSAIYANNPTTHGCFNAPGIGYISMNGTSMATPNVAGAASLVRQYFKKERGINLKGHQLKALLIASASRPDGSKTPDMFIGHGIVDLSKILSFGNEFGVALSNDDTNILNSVHKVAKVKVINAETSLKIVLSYFDIEVNMESLIPIFIDLDLVVVSPSGNKRYLGDHRKDNDAEHFSTNEKVIIDKEELEIGEYEIHIYSNEAFNLTFGVVAVGPVDNQRLTFSNTFDCGCNKCNEDGRCKCDSSHVGNHCQISLIDFGSNQQGSVTIDPFSIKHIKIGLYNSQRLTVTRPDSINGSFSNLWYSETCHSTLSDYDGLISLKEVSNNFFLTYEQPFCIAIFNNHFNQQEFKINIKGDLPPSDADMASKWKKNLIITASLLSIIIIILIIIIFLLVKKYHSIANTNYMNPSYI